MVSGPDLSTGVVHTVDKLFEGIRAGHNLDLQGDVTNRYKVCAAALASGGCL